MLKTLFPVCSGARWLQPSTIRSLYYGPGSNSQSQAARESMGDALSHSLETVTLPFDKYTPSNPCTLVLPLVICHGLFGSKTNNRTVAMQLAERLKRDVYCVDLRNHGEAPHIDRLDYPSLAADIERFCRDHRLEEPILVGHSMGAKAVMAVGLRSPKLASMIVSVDNAPVDLSHGGGSVFAQYVRQLRLITERELPMVKDMKEADKILAQVESRLPVRQFLFTNLKRVRKPEPGEFPLQAKIPLLVIGDALDHGNISGWPFDSTHVRWSGDILFIRGSLSTYVPDDLFATIGQFFPRFEIKDVTGGHWLISENPADFMEVLVEYIERKEEQRRDEEHGPRDLFHGHD